MHHQVPVLPPPLALNEAFGRLDLLVPLQKARRTIAVMFVIVMSQSPLSTATSELVEPFDVRPLLSSVYGQRVLCCDTACRVQTSRLPRRAKKSNVYLQYVCTPTVLTLSITTPTLRASQNLTARDGDSVSGSVSTMSDSLANMREIDVQGDSGTGLNADRPLPEGAMRAVLQEWRPKSDPVDTGKQLHERAYWSKTPPSHNPCPI